ncbi:MAG: granule-associated protein [Massilia sp.]|jgi:phasin family protein|nr:granule-associated protein [Massilia sp.]
MYPFAQSVTPAVRTHMDAQVSFMNDVTKSLFRSFQQMCDLNIQLAQTLLEETTLASQQVISHQRPTEALSAASTRAQPAAEKIRSYQQHISRVAADAQVELARVTEQHVQETTRTAKALADEVQRAASEETERGMRTQQETMRQFSDPFQHVTGARGNGGAASMQGAQGASSMQGAQGGGQMGSADTMQQSASAPQTAQASQAGKGTSAGASRKDA